MQGNEGDRTSIYVDSVLSELEAQIVSGPQEKTGELLFRLKQLAPLVTDARQLQRIQDIRQRIPVANVQWQRAIGGAVQREGRAADQISLQRSPRTPKEVVDGVLDSSFAIHNTSFSGERLVGYAEGLPTLDDEVVRALTTLQINLADSLNFILNSTADRSEILQHLDVVTAYIQKIQALLDHQEQVEAAKRAATPHVEQVDDVTQKKRDSLRYFFKEKNNYPPQHEGESDHEFIERVHDSVLVWISMTINDWKYDSKQVRTASWDINPFFGPTGDFKLREAIQVNPSQTYDITTLEGFLYGFPAWFSDEYSRKEAQKMCERTRRFVAQCERAHSRGVAYRNKPSRKEDPGYLTQTFGELKKPDMALILKDVFVTPAEVLDMSEMEKKIRLGTEHILRVFSALSLKEYERRELYLGATADLPSVEKYIAQEWRYNSTTQATEYKAEVAKRKKYEILPFYKKKGEGTQPLLDFRDELLRDLEAMGLSSTAAGPSPEQYLCLENAMALSIGMGIDQTLDWSEKIKADEKTGNPILENGEYQREITVVAAEDAGPKAVLAPAYLGSTNKDLEKGRPNIAIVRYMGQSVAPFARTLCYDYIDEHGDRKRDSLARIIAQGYTRTVDWDTGSNAGAVDESVYNQFTTFYDQLYKPHALCTPEQLIVQLDTGKGDALNDREEFEAAKRYLGITPDTTSLFFSKLRDRWTNRIPLANRVIGPLNIYSLNYRAIEAFPSAGGKRLSSSGLKLINEKYYSKLLVNFRKYWMSAIKEESDSPQHCWDTVVRLRYLFSTNSVIPVDKLPFFSSLDVLTQTRLSGQLSGAVNAHIQEILFDPSLSSDSITPAQVKDVLNKIQDYLKYGLFTELTLYYYMPIIRTNPELKELIASGAYQKVIEEADSEELGRLATVTAGGLPAMHSRELDVVLGVMLESTKYLAALEDESKDATKDGYKYTPGYDRSKAGQPLTKRRLLQYCQTQYRMGIGYQYVDTRTRMEKITRKKKFFRLEPIHEKVATLQSVFNLIRLHDFVESHNKK